MANFKKLIKKSSEDEKDVSSNTSEKNSTTTDEVIEDILPDLDDSEDIVIGDDEDTKTETNTDDEKDEENIELEDEVKSTKSSNSTKSVKKSISKKVLPKKVVTKKKVISKKKEQIKIADITKSWAMDTLLINFLENKWISWLKSVLRKHILDQFNSEADVIWKENEKILSLFEKNLKNNWDIVKWIHSIISRYEKLKWTDFNNWILPEDEIDEIKEENLSKIVQSISIIIWQYRNSLERELVMLDELDYFSNEDWYENTGLHMEVPNVKEKQKEKMIIEKTTVDNKTTVVDESDSLDPLREKELIDEMEKFLSDDNDWKKEKISDKLDMIDDGELVLEEQDDKDEEQKIDTDTIDLDIDNDGIVDATVEVPKNSDIDDSELDIDLPTDSNNRESSKEEDNNKNKSSDSEELDMNFLDDLDTEENKETPKISETKTSNDQFDVDEFLKTLDSFGGKQDSEKKQDSDTISNTQEWDDDNDEIIIKV